MVGEADMADAFFMRKPGDGHEQKKRAIWSVAIKSIVEQGGQEVYPPKAHSSKLAKKRLKKYLISTSSTLCYYPNAIQSKTILPQMPASWIAICRIANDAFSCMHRRQLYACLLWPQENTQSIGHGHSAGKAICLTSEA